METIEEKGSIPTHQQNVKFFELLIDGSLNITIVPLRLLHSQLPYHFYGCRCKATKRLDTKRDKVKVLGVADGSDQARILTPNHQECSCS